MSTIILQPRQAIISSTSQLPLPSGSTTPNSIPTPIISGSSTAPNPPTLTEDSTPLVVTATQVLAGATNEDLYFIPTATAEAQTSHVGKNDNKTVLITIGSVGGVAILILLIYWAATHVTSRRNSLQYEKDLEEGTRIPAISPASRQGYNATPIPQRSMSSLPSNSPEVPFIKKAMTFKRQSKNPYNIYFSDSLARRCSSMHPGTKVLFGKSPMRMPDRKPVPGGASRYASPPTEHTESIWSDDGEDDASTVLGDTTRSQRRAAAGIDVYYPLPPGRTIASWLSGNGPSRMSSDRSHRSKSVRLPLPTNGLSRSGSGRLGFTRSSSTKTRTGHAEL